jgi:hypothetical protein
MLKRSKWMKKSNSLRTLEYFRAYQRLKCREYFTFSKRFSLTETNLFIKKAIKLMEFIS